MTQARPTIICVINEDWFFVSHFLPWAIRAKREGFDVVVLTRMAEAARRIAEAGIAVVPASAARRGVVPTGLLAAAGQLKALVKAHQPAIVHAFGIHGMSIAALARLRGASFPLVCSITGLGYLATGRSFVRRALVRALGFGLRLVLDRAGTVWLAENDADGARLGLVAAASQGRHVQLGGAGVDLVDFPAQPMPAGPGLKLLLVARMVRSKGIDLAVAAVRQGRSVGGDVSLTLVGAPDGDNPGAYSRAELETFAAEPGVCWLGAQGDIAALHAAHHAFILPSRGGEGLPKALLEASASARPSIVSDVPGCRDAVVDGETGFIVPAGDVAALAEAIAKLAHADRAAMGAAARLLVEAGSDLEAVSASVIAVYRRLLARPKG
ncbi:glycosyltransferase [Phreatobacter aquaticus]|uniref:glycosyltransferase n=1 Tax=Phreatobacter aquaticus TaxID=2570229 RepID=UPI00143DA369|nr:glycosyltransferase [Phreatobacter aquaticus]